MWRITKQGMITLGAGDDIMMTNEIGSEFHVSTKVCYTAGLWTGKRKIGRIIKVLKDILNLALGRYLFHFTSVFLRLKKKSDLTLCI